MISIIAACLILEYSVIILQENNFCFPVLMCSKCQNVENLGSLRTFLITEITFQLKSGVAKVQFLYTEEV
jgi:hypothetical protein